MKFILVGEGGQGDPNLPLLVPYIPSSCPFILAFLPIALVYRLQNTKDCRVTYPPPTFSSLPSLIPSAHILRYLASLSSLPTFPQKLILLLPGDHLHTMKFLNILFERASDPL